MSASQNQPTTRLETAPVPPLEINVSRNFLAWMAERDASLAVTTYQAGKLILLGRKPEGRLSAFQRVFQRCLGLCSASDGQTLWMSSQFQIWRFENVLEPGSSSNGFDRMYVPQVAYTTGDVDAHDIAIELPQGSGRHHRDGPEGVPHTSDSTVVSARPVFVNTLFSCLATVSDRFSFEPLWRPPFISRLAAEDRCHLNGLAVRDGRPAYVTACSQSDTVDGWRDVRADGGCVIDVDANETIVSGLSMPHSPRWHNDRLWLLDSGRGQFGYVDTEDGEFEPVVFCPGYARGLTFAGNYAIVGLSRPRHEETFRGLPLDAELANRKAAARCGILVIDLTSGDVVHWLRFDGQVDELYDVAVVPATVRPQAVGMLTDEIRHNICFEDNGRRTSWSGREH